MTTENFSPGDEFTGDAGGKLGELLVQERGKAIEVGDRIERPLDRYWPGHRLNPGVPHVRSHCTTRSWGTRTPADATRWPRV